MTTALPGVAVSKILPREALRVLEAMPQPCGIVIFGASGDLAHRKLFPALFSLLKDKVLPKSYYLLGVARTPMTDEAFRDSIRQSLGTVDPRACDDFLAHCRYFAGDYNDPKTYGKLKEQLTALDKEQATGGRHLFYLSVPPALYGAIAGRLGGAGLATESKDAWVRIIVEKPFGSDLASAQALNKALHEYFAENQIYRIDHYLGKETVQNILMFRFANAMFEPVWNSKYIDHVQITAAETDGVGHRAGYYETAGVMRDMFQNHLFQLLSLVAMEPPSSLSPDAVRDEKSKVMASLCGLDCSKNPEIAVRGQYRAGEIEGKKAPGYREEDGVAANSCTETFGALRVEVDNWRWHGVPFYLRSGKRLNERLTEITVEFKHVPTSVFRPVMADQLDPNVLRFRIQPNEGISLRFEAKHPGPKLCMSSVTMQFDYQEAFGIKPPEAYARLFLDVMLGDPTLFARQDWLTCAWGFLDPILAHWATQKERGLEFYEAGSKGPAAADRLLERDGRRWQ